MEKSRIERTVEFFKNNDKGKWFTINELIAEVLFTEEGWDARPADEKRDITVRYVMDFTLSEIFIFKKHKDGDDFKSLWNLKYRDPIQSASLANDVATVEEEEIEEIADDDPEDLVEIDGNGSK
jgi:hypothetical protein